MRKNNKQDMTIREQIQAVADEICSTRCKYPDQWDEEKEGIELCDSEYCKNCPLNEL